MADTTIGHEALAAVFAQLTADEAAPGAREREASLTPRQPVHVVYGGAHLFKAETARKMGQTALRVVDEQGPDFASFARAVGLPGGERLPHDVALVAELAEALDRGEAPSGSPEARLAHAVFVRVREKLSREPVEDYRIDFEDGYGARPDAEEDEHARGAARELARAFRERLAPPFTGLRVKSFEAPTRARAARTLDLFVTTLCRELGGPPPAGFVVTLPKVSSPAQVAALSSLLASLEAGLGLPARSLSLELMIELPLAVIDPSGRAAPRSLVEAAEGRCRAVHFGTYDYTAALGVTAAEQRHDHPSADFARHVMQVSLAGSGVRLSDGATTLLPIGPHRAKEGAPLSASQLDDNARAVRRGLRLHFANVSRSLAHGFYQGWDLHPAQLPARYAAVHAFFLSGVEEAASRLRNFVERAARATRVGAAFDDAATGQGLLNYFLLATAAGAMSEDEACRLTTLTVDELRGRSFSALSSPGRSSSRTG